MAWYLIKTRANFILRQLNLHVFIIIIIIIIIIICGDERSLSKSIM
jgi:cytochrome bd-type quinol oxidase subunit 1